MSDRTDFKKITTLDELAQHLTNTYSSETVLWVSEDIRDTLANNMSLKDPSLSWVVDALNFLCSDVSAYRYADSEAEDAFETVYRIYERYGIEDSNATSMDYIGETFIYDTPIYDFKVINGNIYGSLDYVSADVEADILDVFNINSSEKAHEAYANKKAKATDSCRRFVSQGRCLVDNELFIDFD